MELVFALLFLAVGLSTRPVLGGDAPPRCFAEPLCLGAATGNVELVTRELKEGTWSSAQDRLKVNMLYGSGSDVFYGSGSDATGSLTALGTEAVDFTGRNGFTALMVGAGHGHRAWAAGEVPDPQAKRQTEVVGLLIRANAAVDVQDDFGYTALMNAAEVGACEQRAGLPPSPASPQHTLVPLPTPTHPAPTHPIRPHTPTHPTGPTYASALCELTIQTQPQCIGSRT